MSTPNGLTSSINQSSKKQQSKWRSINCQVCGILDEKINEEGFSNLLRTVLNILVLVGTRYNDNFSPVEFTFQKLTFQMNFCPALMLQHLILLLWQISINDVTDVRYLVFTVRQEDFE